MPPRSKIAQLPAEMRSELDRELIDRNFSGYADVEAWLGERGYEISRSAVGVYGLKLQQRLSAIRASTDAARLITQAAPDDADERSNAIISLVQTEIFESLLALQEASEEDDPAERVAILGKAAKNIATLTRASVTRNKWAVEHRAKVDAVAAEVKKIASQAGVSEETMAAIDARIMGIV